MSEKRYHFFLTMGGFMTLYILYSADYELFLGGNYCSETEVLIDPTYELLDLADRLGIPITLFADVLSILRYRQQNLFAFPENAEKQLKDAILRGHDVQSHVHPHWNYTQIVGKKYDVDLRYYLLGKLDDDREMLYVKIRNCLLTSRIYLNSLLRPANNNYTCIAFRSGGYGLQPNSDIIIKALTDTGFLLDSSIAPGFKVSNNTNRIDYSAVPRLANYYLNDNLTADAKKGIFEIPIASCRLDFGSNFGYKINELFRFLKNITTSKKLNKSSEKQKGYTIQEPVSTPVYTKYLNFLRSFNSRVMELNCSADDEKMFECTKKYLEQFDLHNQDVFFSINMHPKSMTNGHFQALEKYHHHMKNYYKDIRAVSFQQAAEMLGTRS
jgi:hypothetical protein